jgi:hypothetical protein
MEIALVNFIMRAKGTPLPTPMLEQNFSTHPLPNKKSQPKPKTPKNLKIQPLKPHTKTLEKDLNSPSFPVYALSTFLSFPTTLQDT